MNFFSIKSTVIQKSLLAFLYDINWTEDKKCPRLWAPGVKQLIKNNVKMEYYELPVNYIGELSDNKKSISMNMYEYIDR